MILVFLFCCLFVQITILHASHQYLGCYVDQIGDRDLDIFMNEYEQLTPQQCLDACKEQNFPYAGIQYGNECRCGRKYGKYGRASEYECNYVCSTSEKCGGNNRNSIYRTSSTCQNNLIGYQGCFNSVLLQYEIVVVNSIDECIQHCSLKYNYAGITNGNLCHCGNDINHSIASDLKLCNISCLQSSNELAVDCCGGLNSLSVYYIGYYQAGEKNDLLVHLKRVGNDTTVYSSSYTSAVLTSTSSSMSSVSSNVSILPYTSSMTSSSLSNGTSNTTQNVSTSIMSNATFATTLITTFSSTNNTNSSNTTMSTLTITNTMPTSTNLGTTILQSSTNLINTTSNSPVTSSQQNTDLALSSFAYTSAPMTSSMMTSMPASTSNNAITSTNPVSNLSTPISPTISSTMLSNTTANVLSSLSSTMTTSQQNTSQIVTNALTSSSTTLSTQTTVNSSLDTGATTQVVNSTQSSTINTITTSISSIITSTQAVNLTTTTTTTTAAPIPGTTVATPFIITTTIIVDVSRNFSPTDNSSRESVRRGLIQVINLAFTCISNSSFPNCTQSKMRTKRSICPTGYDVIIISVIADISTPTTQQYSVSYVVKDPCNSNTPVSPTQTKTATDTLTYAQIVNALGFAYSGQLIKSTSINNAQTSTNDPKLWIIGAVLGPVGFVILLVFTFLYLHFKCRPRPMNRNLAKSSHTASPPPTRSTSYLPMSDESTRKERPSSGKGTHSIISNNPLVGSRASSPRVAPSESDKSSDRTPRHAASTEIPLEEIRHQNDIERWRNKIRLQDRFEQLTDRPSDSVPPHPTSSRSSQYDNQAFENDFSNINLLPAKEAPSNRSPRRTPPEPEIEAGRTKLHRLLDEVLDRAESENSYNPDSESERLKRRRQRRRNRPTSDDTRVMPVHKVAPPKPHIPVVAQVTERPDTSVMRLYYNPYEAGDRAHHIANFTPVELKPKYTKNNPPKTQYTPRSDPQLHFDDSVIPDRAKTAVDSYAAKRRAAKVRLETDAEAAMRHDGGRVHQQRTTYSDDSDVNYFDRPSRDRSGYRGQAHNAWTVSDVSDNPQKAHDYGNDYQSAQKSVVNTKSILSSIQSELKNINSTSSNDYHA